MVYDQTDPIGQERLDLHAGIIASTMANIHRSKKSRPFTPKQFMLDCRPKTARGLDLSARLKAAFGSLKRT